ncbi:MAG: rod shape-determining protein RodA [Gammaproteobacteria bacterium]|nr:rod shape-determining protein RodA [Gammaproteobacteria bacterium]MDA7969795.1 rod shape-determining protein RodA [Gammaproteobacteria bacterium]MDA7989611.1 rod shape-determining protein RodA [Gammaproteobacteria bacterium]MDA8006878.1 rod shape-determining protein RodA [Gammaproteobacteria bacterium]MDA8010728.1 rod shape-determining protein RodA [Gammaproteobacteria bacterium]
MMNLLPLRGRALAPAADLPLLIALCMLCALGMMVLYGVGAEGAELLRRQGARIALAFALMFVFALIPPAALQRWSPHLYAVGIALLLLVLLTGSAAKGAQRWLDFGLFRFQPSELIKLALPMMLAWTLTRFPLPTRGLTLVLAAAVLAAPFALVVIQPDLGTAVVILLSGGMMIFLAGISWRVILGLGAAAGALVPILWAMLHDYQRRRILTLFDPWSDPLGAGYHTIQSVIAVGAGGWSGKGWLAGTQSRLDFIPESSTDFIFAVYAEEFGLLGGLLLLGLYLFVVARGLIIAFAARDAYSRLLGGCLSLGFFLQVFFNMGMVSGIFPVVGMPLPLLSYGGTSMATTMIAFGMIMSIRRERMAQSQ